MTVERQALFIAEGSSDAPLADIVERLFARQQVNLRVTAPDLSRLPRKVGKDLTSTLHAGLELLGDVPKVLVIHRDANGAGRPARLDEIRAASTELAPDAVLVPIVPVRMTEAWLLLDEVSIRRVAGNPKGRTTPDLPKHGEIERCADPKGCCARQLRPRRTTPAGDWTDSTGASTRTAGNCSTLSTSTGR
ncbi:MAG: hypothetical protein ACRCXL_05665 [Dermatophilaceae bacterium]